MYLAGGPAHSWPSGIVLYAVSIVPAASMASRADGYAPHIAA